MFGFLKDKLKKIKDVFTNATTEVKEEPKDQKVKDEKPKKVEKQPVKPAKPAPKTPPKKAEKTKGTKDSKPAQAEKADKKRAEDKKKTEEPLSLKKQAEEPKPILSEIPVEEDLDAVEEESIDEETDETEEQELEEEIALEEQEEVIAEEEEEIEPVVEEKDDIEQEPIEEELPQEKKRSFFDRILGRKKEEKVEEKKAEETAKPEPKQTPKPAERKPVAKVEAQEEPTGFFGKLKAAIVTKKLERAEYDSIFDEIEIELLENNVALEVVDKLKEDLWQGISTERFSRFAPEKRVQAALTQSISELFIEPFDILKAAKEKDIYVICAIGINGSGKTTTLAKLAQYFKDQNLEPVLAAGDTFRAAAIQQLEEHANKIGVKIIKQQYGADAAAVAFDAIQYAKANKCRVVLIDTAGRLHSNTNLMEEMKKIVRVAKPDTTIFIGEATTGNDCVEQAVQFSQAVDIDGIVLSKVDVDERGGAALSISYVTRKPILFFGTGQTYKDLEPFDRDKIVAQLTEE